MTLFTYEVFARGAKLCKLCVEAFKNIWRCNMKSQTSKIGAFALLILLILSPTIILGKHAF